MALAAMLASVAVVCNQTTFAQTGINLVVRDTLPPTLAVTSPVSGTTINGPQLTIAGTLHNIGQIMVYIDGVYRSTIPVDIGASTFSAVITLDPGPHALHLVGYDPYTSTQLDQVFSVTYTPVTPTAAPQPTPGQVVNNVVGQGAQVANQTIGQAQSQINAASEVGPMKTLTDGLFTVLVDAGVIVPSSTSQTKLMLTRVGMVSAGFALTILPGAAYWWIMRRMPLLIRSTALAGPVPWMVRLVGIGLMAVPFLVF